MNYIKEINAFHDEQFTNPVSGKAMKLWFTLIHINNKTCWKQTFTVAASVLCLHGKLTNSSFKRARTELRDKGYIRYESRAGNQSAIYEIISLDRTNNQDQNKDEKTSTPKQDLDHSMQSQANVADDFSLVDQNQSNPAEDLDHNVAPLVKLKETKQRPSAAAGAISFFEENFGKISPYIHSELKKWMNQSGQALIMTAMKRALDRGKASWGYVKGILQAWQDKDIQTVEGAEKELITFQKRPNNAYIKQADEIIPDWFYERGTRKQTPTIETTQEKHDRIEIDRLLAAFS